MFTRNEHVCLELDNDFNQAWEDAYMEACENDSPNSFGFDQMFERIYDRICVMRNLFF